jgi:hypothetical protein
MAQASRHLEGVDGLIVIGGNGSLAGAHALSQRCQATKVIGIPASIDNDIGCTSTLTAWNPTSPDGKPTADPAVFRFPLQQVLSETERLIDGTSPVTRRRVQMMEMVEGVLPL